MSLIVPTGMKKPNLRYAQQYVDEANGKAKTEAPAANRGSLEANFAALGECASPEEQKALIFGMLGDYLTCEKPLRLAGNKVMVATYVRPQRSKGGILYTDKRRDGNRFEGKVGLIIALGPTAFKYFGAFPWEGHKWEIGDWVWYRASDAAERGFRDVWCRTIDDDLIEGEPPSPQDIY